MEQLPDDVRSYGGAMRMRSFGAGFELSVVAAALMIVMLGVMWIQRPGAACTLSAEGPRALLLSRATDREHLATDLASADRSARRYMLATDDLNQQQTRFVECEDTLVHEIAARHGLSPDQVRANRIDGSPLRQSVQWR
jgi:hypothetical protein